MKTICCQRPKHWTTRIPGSNGSVISRAKEHYSIYRRRRVRPTRRLWSSAHLMHSTPSRLCSIATHDPALGGGCGARSTPTDIVARDTPGDASMTVGHMGILSLVET